MYLNWVEEFVRYVSKSSFSISGFYSCNFGFIAKLNKFMYDPSIFSDFNQDFNCSTE